MELKKLGPYLLKRPIGKGGMGTVYEAVHEGTKETAAVKSLIPKINAALDKLPPLARPKVAPAPETISLVDDDDDAVPQKLAAASNKTPETIELLD